MVPPSTSTGSGSTVMARHTLRRDVLRGLRAKPKRIPCKYLYDQRGCELFEQICGLDEYYLTRTETAIMELRASEMADSLGPAVMLIELGSGSSIKTRILLDRARPAVYVPIDIAANQLAESARRIAQAYPDVEVLAHCADFTRPFVIPPSEMPVKRRVVYFPGSTIGNFSPAEMQDLLLGVARVCRPGGQFLVGIDLVKDPAVLEAAYNDRQGVTAQFNLNLLRRINRELEADFSLDRFRHVAYWNPGRSRVEIYLESLEDQRVRVAGQVVRLEVGERIHTENSHKFSVDRFAASAATAGFSLKRVWTDADEWFAVVLLSL